MAVRLNTPPHDVVDAVLGALPADVPVVAVRDGPRTVVAVEPDQVLRLSGPGALLALDGITQGWWAGFLAYDLGRSVERVADRVRDDLGLPDVLLGRFDVRLVLSPDAPPIIRGDGPARRTLEDALARLDNVAAPRPPKLGDAASSLDRPAWEDAVNSVLEHIWAGDCYQVNLTRRLSWDADPAPVSLYRVLARGNPAPHGALVRIDDIGVASASPERFLRVDGNRVSTRPIKGTGTDPDLLRASAKDRAENVMIVDLARNDLGRVCAYGTVQVPALCEPERHPGLWHLVSTVTGTLREDVGWGSLVRAVFPPASITGAPKPRVMQIIESLEPVRRGVYCGAVGFIDADRHVCDLNVAIRTFTTAGGLTTFGVGGGIVADSEPGAEWEETELKAKRLLSLVS